MANETTVSDLTNLVRTYYDRLLLETLEPATRFYQFGSKKPLPKGEGNAVIWNRPYSLAVGVVLTEGTAPTANELSTYKISAKIQQLGGFVKESDLVQLTAVTDTMKLATERLALQAAQTVDRYIMEAIVMNQDLTAANGGSAVHVAKVSASRLAEGDKQLITSTGGSNGANVIAVSDVRSCAFILRRKNVPTVDGENYVGIKLKIVPLKSSLINGESLRFKTMVTLSKQVKTVQLQRLSEKTLAIA